MTSNNRLDISEIHLIFADGRREEARLEKRLQAIVAKLLAMRGEIEDRRSSQFVIHMGRRGDVLVDVTKRY